ncbi:MAG: PD-(D/E)XK nuclease family protein [Candidatus Cyclobacteriaceae bacterium M2_1C_046]
MKTFLEEVAEALGPKESWLNKHIIFPNRRAGVFFRDELAKLAGDKPVFAPEIYSLEDFVFQHVPLQQADTLTLTGLLFKSYQKIFNSKETFSDFFFWGKMILRDFDDIDQHLSDPKSIYSIIEQQKQLDLSFGFLSPEQIRILSSFWRKFTDNPGQHKEQFINIWKKLYPLYNDFQDILKEEGYGYKGMAYKTFASNPDKYLNTTDQGLIFAGFNALTKAEEVIITHYLRKGNAKILWDIDDYYFSRNEQEAGRFYRELSKKSTFSNTFPEELPKNIQQAPKIVEIVGVPYRAGQAKLVGQRIDELLTENPDFPLNKIAIVLPDEQLLFSVLNALPPSVKKFNVTMGFPVETSTVFSLLLNCLSLQDNVSHRSGEEYFYFRPLKKILRHPVIQEIIKNAADDFLLDMLKKNQIYISEQEIKELHPLFQIIFQIQKENYTPYLLQVLQSLIAYEEELTPENTTALHFIVKQLRELQIFEEELNLHYELRHYSRFLRQLLSSNKIPFEGEPLEGLQIMGVLETRNLDFEHVFVLSLNEEYFPADSRLKSFIPYNVRKAFNLPVFDQQDAIYAYLFYRLFQRSKHVQLFYNTEGNVVGGQEKSRFIQQLVHEKPFPVENKLLNTPVKPQQVEQIIIDKDEAVQQLLENYLFSENEANKWLYPSTINSYLNCRLQFYFKYIAGIKEADEMDEEVTSRLFGNILHDGMEKLYKEHMEQKGNNLIEPEDFVSLKKKVKKIVEQGFKKEFGVEGDKQFEFTGQNIIQRDMLIKFMQQILSQDKAVAPFKIIALETDNKENYTIGFPIQIKGKERKVGIKGKIDRLDQINGSVRVIDYKTGRDELNFPDVPALFDRENDKRNKAAFQTLCYTLLYDKVQNPEGTVVPGLYSRNNLFSSPFEYRLSTKHNGSKYTPIVDYRQVKDQYEKHLQLLLQELFNPDIAFDQTEDLKQCSYCSYKGICQR